MWKKRSLPLRLSNPKNSRYRRNSSPRERPKMRNWASSVSFSSAALLSKRAKSAESPKTSSSARSFKTSWLRSNCLRWVDPPRSSRKRMKTLTQPVSLLKGRCTATTATFLLRTRSTQMMSSTATPSTPSTTTNPSSDSSSLKASRLLSSTKTSCEGYLI